MELFAHMYVPIIFLIVIAIIYEEVRIILILGLVTRVRILVVPCLSRMCLSNSVWNTYSG